MILLSQVLANFDDSVTKICTCDSTNTLGTSFGNDFLLKSCMEATLSMLNSASATALVQEANTDDTKKLAHGHSESPQLQSS